MVGGGALLADATTAGMVGVGVALCLLFAGVGVLYVAAKRQRESGVGGYLPRRAERMIWISFAITTGWLAYVAYRLATWEVSVGLQTYDQPLWGDVAVVAAMWLAFAGLMLFAKTKVFRPAGSPPDLLVYVRGLPRTAALLWGKRTVGSEPAVKLSAKGSEFTELYFENAGPWISDATLARHAARDLDREALYAADADGAFVSALPSGEERAAVWPEGEPPRLAPEPAA